MYNIYNRDRVVRQLTEQKMYIYISKLVCFWEALIICLKLIIFGLSRKVVNLPVAFSLVY
jgi:hypothetical protein